MPDNLLIFSDGTSNTRRTQTNVYQFYEQLKGKPGQQCFYDPGVGSFSGDLPGKAFGVGINTNIIQCYDFIVSHYEPGCKIF